jgi:cytochrome c peroxidase
MTSRRTVGLFIALAASALAACTATASGSASATVDTGCDLDPAVSRADCDALHTMALPAALPPAVGNAKADDAAAAALGFNVFFDARFSSSSNVRCATCHLPEDHFADAKPVSMGLETISRNSPTVLNASRMGVVFWDGRADSVWSQALFAFENSKEMGFSRLAIAHRIAKSYTDTYAAAFGPLPPLDDAQRFPDAGKPGDAAWEAMAPADQDAINRVAANVGKALEAYERKASAGASAFDRYLGGDRTALTASQRRGLAQLTRAGCLDCHSGPMFSDMEFHNLGVPADVGAAPDRGRADGIAVLRANVFNAAGVYADPPASAPPVMPSPTDADVGAFRTPSLRNVTLSAPYGHNGHFATLIDAIAFHVRGGGRDGAGFVGTVDAKIVRRDDVTDADVADIADFLSSLEGRGPDHPWNDWPQK